MPYTYTPLATGEFRVLQITTLSGRKLEGRLVHQVIATSDQGETKYEALSYTWGDSEKPEIIIIDGQPLSITWSLFQALYHIRAGHQRLWVDAICINQEDLHERQQQVQEMSKIYQGAQNVVIWLGSATRETDHLLQSLKDLDQTQSSDDPVNEAPCIGSDELASEFGMKEILSRPWFARVWIIQEVAFAKAVSVWCGSSNVSGRVLALAPSLTSVKPGRQRQAVLDLMPGSSKRNSWWQEPRDLLSLLQRFQACQASEARDRFYALYGLCSDKKLFDHLTPDYRSSDMDVVTSMVYYLFGLNTLDYFDLPSYMTISSFMQDIDRLEETIWKKFDENSQAREIAISPLQVAAERKSGAVAALTFLLKSDNHRSLSVTEATVLAAVSNPGYSSTLIEPLLDYRWHEVEITETVLAAAIHNIEGSLAIVDLLLKRRGHVIMISATVIRAANSNLVHGKRIITMLLENSARASTITEADMRLLIEEVKTNAPFSETRSMRLKPESEVLRLASLLIKNHNVQPEALGLVFRECALAITDQLTENYGDRITITEELIATILQRYIVRQTDADERIDQVIAWVLERCTKDPDGFTDRTVALIIAHCSSDNIQKAMQGNNRRITQSLVEAIIQAHPARAPVGSLARMSIKEMNVWFSEEDVLKLQSSPYTQTEQGRRVVMHMQRILQEFAPEEDTVIVEEKKSRWSVWKR